MKKATVTLLAAGAAATAAAIPYFYRQNTNIQATQYVFYSKKVPQALEGYRIVQASDLHNACFGKDNRQLLALLEAQRPDCIVFTGDLINSHRCKPEKVYALAEKAVKLASCYCVTGNHEHRMEKRELEGFLGELEKRGVCVLRNEAVRLGLGRDSFRLLGVDCQQARIQVLTKLMAGHKEELNILLSHKPHFTEAYEASGVDLVLTGHAHGGQFRLPIIGGLYAPGQGILPKYTAGMYRLGDTVMEVSRGLGNSSFDLRIHNKPELVCITLRHKAE